MRQRRRTFFYMFVVLIYLSILVLSGCEGEESAETELTEIAEVETEESSTEETQEEESSGEPEEIYVYVCGQVRNPGVYKLESGERITHALMAAGGMTDAAASDYLNQAEVLEDGQKIYVPTQEEAEKLVQSEISEGTESSDGKININTADKSQLMQLSGIGESRAEAIIAYREANSGFKNIEEIKNIEGIKEGIFNRIKEQIKVE